MTSVSYSPTVYKEAETYYFEEAKSSINSSFERLADNSKSIEITFQEIKQTPIMTLEQNTSSTVVALPKIVLSTFAISIFFAMSGLLSILFFVLRDVYIIHPYMAFLSFIGGSFLFSSSWLAVKGK